jgi:hypothetical protein
VGVVNKNQNRERNPCNIQDGCDFVETVCGGAFIAKEVSTPELLVTRSESKGVNAWRAVLGSRARIGLAIRAP